MNTAWMEMAAGGDAPGFGFVVTGLAVVALLLGAFILGLRHKRRRPPRPDEQPRLPDGGPVRETRERREPDEVPRGQGRLTPHELKTHGNQSDRRSPTQERPRWNEGSSGSFGSGGPGGR
ncbi:DUF6479 family protein [Streptomyces coeruleorubidus]|uniref:DUF6479 family protein n=1 Tax=Streptomyces coeruleorubidus TaxID=116188 RepID=UPI0036F73964